ncbi:ABC transporter ATP-binding protein [Georgenia faecalis]|uniref:ABC transporter ATP-binding protein n=1 Tax=Georgenia faecalis TaxID=2483799 RepID=A0ABV9DE56_9MICO|nr:ABC transporter ATP-binding protein [Georgenia faecalis]
MTRIIATLRQLLPLLPASARRFLVGYAVGSSALALLDIAALGLLALAATPMIQGDPVNLPLVGEIGPSGYIWLIAAVCVLIAVKSMGLLALQWVLTRRMAHYELVVGDRLFQAYIAAPWTERLRRNSNELVRMADIGIANTTGGVLLPVATLPVEVMTSISVLVVLVVAQPVTAAITLVYLGAIAALLYFVLSRKALVAGRVNRDYSFRVNTLVSEMVATLKEITLRGKTREVAAVVHDNRTHAVRGRANIHFLNAVPKFVLEVAIIGGFILVGGVAYLTGGAAAAITAVAMFAVAGFRMVPSLTRVQALITQMTSNLPHAEAVIADIRDAQRYVAEAETVGHEAIGHEPRQLVLDGVSFAYPTADEPAVRDIDLVIPMGSSLALVGASGAGKSTLVDILLGLLVPSSGRIMLDDRPLTDVLAAWRARVGYVPQDVSLFDATVAQNVALTWGTDIDEERVRSALARAQLLETIDARPGGIHARVGERGLALSGGQRQRLGIARALYADPLVLVMDEATSALDTATEDAVARAIRDLHGEVTVISVAHRLSTVRHSDQVCFMADSRIAARGTFDEVVAAAPEFARQAALAGLV